MKLGLLSAFLCAVSIWVTAAFAQLPQIHEMSAAAIQTPTKKQARDEAKPKITLQVDDFAHLDPAVLAGARKVTTEILAAAGVQTVWLDCPVYHTDCGREAEKPQFILRILAPSMAKDIVGDEALGFAIPCDKKEEACLFYIFYYRISDLAAARGLSPDRILGHVMAHEIGRVARPQSSRSVRHHAEHVKSS